MLAAAVQLCIGVVVAPPSGYVIRPFTNQDALKTATLLHAAFTPPEGERYNFLQSGLMIAENTINLRTRAAGGNLMFVCCSEADEAVIGFIECYTDISGISESTLPERLKAKLQHPYLSSLAVATCSRKLGIGALLMRTVEEALRTAPPVASAISLEVEEENVPALALYEKMGYKVVSRDAAARKLVGDIVFGRSVPCVKVWLEKTLQPPRR